MMSKRKASAGDMESKHTKSCGSFIKDIWDEIIKHLTNYEIYTKVLRLSKDICEIAKKRLDPSANGNCGVKWAIMHQRGDMVKRLLNDSRVDPSANNNELFGFASRFCNILAQKELLDKGMRPFGVGGWRKRQPPIEEALNSLCHLGGCAELVKSIVEDERFDGRVCLDHGLILLGQSGDIPTFDVLIKSKKLEGSKWDFALMQAIRDRQKQLAKYILEYTAVDTKLNLSACLGIACRSGDREFVQLLLDDERLDPGRIMHHIGGINNSHPDVVPLLESHRKTFFLFHKMMNV